MTSQVASLRVARGSADVPSGYPEYVTLSRNGASGPRHRQGHAGGSEKTRSLLVSGQFPDWPCSSISGGLESITLWWERLRPPVPPRRPAVIRGGMMSSPCAVALPNVNLCAIHSHISGYITDIAQSQQQWLCCSDVSWTDWAVLWPLTSGQTVLNWACSF